MKRMSRRNATRLVLGAPIAAAVAAPLGSWLAPMTAVAAEQTPAAGAAEEAAGPSGLGRFLAREEADLTASERKEVRRSVAQLEHSLREVRNFVVSNDVPPAGTFRALRSKR